jgi:chemotaxis protein CheC
VVLNLSEKNDLPSELIDALQEVGNIGAGHAANALADILNRRIDLSLPKFNILSLEDLSTVSWGNKNEWDPYAFIMVETKGFFKFVVLVIFNKETLGSILKLVSGENIDPTNLDFDELSKFDQSAITEIGNILALHYLTAIGDFLEIKFKDEELPTQPSLVIETSEAVLLSLAANSSADFMHLISIECDIFASDMILKPVVALIPDNNTIIRARERLFS